MAQRFSPPEEIQAALGLTPKQFQRAVRVHYKKSVAQWWEQQAALGRYLVRQKQFDKATEGEGHAVLLKWLGIQYLGQREHVDVIHKADPNSNPEAAARAEREKGFAILTPEGVTTVLPAPGGQKKLEAQPHDEQPIVEAVIVEEENKEAAKASGESPTREPLVQTYGGET